MIFSLELYQIYFEFVAKYFFERLQLKDAINI